MHWLNLIVVAFLYALVGSLIGVSYALFTGAGMSSYGRVVDLAAVFGPVLLLVLAAFRKLMRESDIPITRVIYHTLLITFAAPVLLYGAQLIAAAAGVSKLARVFEVLKYWSIPLVFITAVMYGIWRVIEGNRLRATSTSGRPSGGPPSGDGSATSAEAQRLAAPDSPHRDGHRSAMVACFSGRSTPFRWVRRPVEVPR